MKTYLVSYDLIKPETHQDYVPLINTLKSAPGWAKPLESLWLIETPFDAAKIMATLRTVTDNNDKLLIIEVTNDWIALNLSSQVITWMRNTIK